MKTRIATILAVVMFAAAAIVSGAGASARGAEESPAAPPLNTRGAAAAAAAPQPTNWNFEKKPRPDYENIPGARRGLFSVRREAG